MDTADAIGMCRVTRHLPECSMSTSMRGGYSKKWKAPETGPMLDGLSAESLPPVEPFPIETLPIETFRTPSLPPETVLPIESVPAEAFKLEPMNP